VPGSWHGGWAMLVPDLMRFKHDLGGPFHSLVPLAQCRVGRYSVNVTVVFAEPGADPC
jgi:hypothetical protein